MATFKFEEKVTATRNVFMEANSLKEAMLKWERGDAYLTENNWEIEPQDIEIKSVECL